MVKKKETGFDKLAHLIKSESEDIRKDVGKVEDDIANLKNDVARLEVKVDKVDSKLGAFENNEVDKRKQLEVRVTHLEKKISV